MLDALHDLASDTALHHLRLADILAAPHVPMAKVVGLSKKAWDSFDELWHERTSEEIDELLLLIERKLGSMCFNSLGIAATPSVAAAATTPSSASSGKSPQMATTSKKWYVLTAA